MPSWLSYENQQTLAKLFSAPSTSLPASSSKNSIGFSSLPKAEEQSTSVTLARFRRLYSTISNPTTPENGDPKRIQLNSCLKSSAQAPAVSRRKIGMKLGRRVKNLEKCRKSLSVSTWKKKMKRWPAQIAPKAIRSLQCRLSASYSTLLFVSSSNTGGHPLHLGKTTPRHHVGPFHLMFLL